MIVHVQIHPVDHLYLELCKLDLDHYLQNSIIVYVFKNEWTLTTLKLGTDSRMLGSNIIGSQKTLKRQKYSYF